jgi:hypothetical protein
VEDTKAIFNTISDSCRAELQRFEDGKGRDIKNAILQLVQINMNQGLLSVDQWKVFLAELKK